MEIWSSPFSPETGPVGPALCIIWNRPVEDTTARVGPACQLLIIQSYQPSYSIEEACAGELVMCREKRGGLAMRFSCRVAQQSRPTGSDVSGGSVTSYMGEASFDGSVRPFEEMPFRLRSIVEDRIRDLREMGER